MNLNLLKKVLPSPSLFIGLLFVPLAVTTYYIVSKFSDKLVTGEEVDYYEVQSDFLRTILFNSNWTDQFNRLMDFFFWGLAAFVIILIIWGIGSARIALKNHRMQESFNNFTQSKIYWHTKFIINIILKVVFIGVILYCLLAIVGKFIPSVSFNTSQTIRDGLNWQTATPLLASVAMIWLYEVLSVVSINLYKSLK